MARISVTLFVLNLLKFKFVNLLELLNILDISVTWLVYNKFKFSIEVQLLKLQNKYEEFGFAYIFLSLAIYTVVPSSHAIMLLFPASETSVTEDGAPEVVSLNTILVIDDLLNLSKKLLEPVFFKNVISVKYPGSPSLSILAYVLSV